MAIFRTTARNFAAHEDNPIHDPARVEAVGWARAAIPGAATFGYLCQPLIETLGERWFTGCRTDVRLLAPLHDGDSLEIELHKGESDWRVFGRVDGRLVAEMVAQTIANPAPTPIGLDQEADHRRAEKVALDWRGLSVGASLTSWTWTPGLIENAEAAAQVDDQDARYRTGRIHPHALLNAANRALTKTFKLPYWLYVGGTVVMHHPIHVGDQLRVGGSVGAKWQRGNHQFVDFSIRLTRGAVLVVAISHRSIVNFGTA